MDAGKQAKGKPTKTEYMIIGHPRRINELRVPEFLRFNDSEIKRVVKTKLLEVIVDQGLNWDEQFNQVKVK